MALTSGASHGVMSVMAHLSMWRQRNGINGVNNVHIYQPARRRHHGIEIIGIVIGLAHVANRHLALRLAKIINVGT